MNKDCNSLRPFARGKSLSVKVYGISIKTIGFLRDFYRNNRISHKGVRDFLTVIYPSSIWMRRSLDRKKARKKDPHRKFWRCSIKFFPSLKYTSFSKLTFVFFFHHGLNYYGTIALSLFLPSTQNQFRKHKLLEWV